MGLIFSFFTVVALGVIVFVGVKTAGMRYMFGVIIPYAAFFAFLIGIIYRVLQWARIPVPFRIPTTAGQGKSFPWIRQNTIDNPFTSLGLIIRMTLEVLVFRSLFRNTRMELRDGPKLSYGSTKWLWMAGLAFHWTFLIILTRHLRLLTLSNPVCVSLGTDKITTVTILDNDQGFLFETNRYDVAEDAGVALIGVLRGTDDTNATVTVDVAASDGNALDGQDYTGLTNTLTFAPG